MNNNHYYHPPNQYHHQHPPDNEEYGPTEAMAIPLQPNLQLHASVPETQAIALPILENEVSDVMAQHPVVVDTSTTTTTTTILATPANAEEVSPQFYYTTFAPPEDLTNLPLTTATTVLPAAAVEAGRSSSFATQSQRPQPQTYASSSSTTTIPLSLSDRSQQRHTPYVSNPLPSSRLNNNIARSTSSTYDEGRIAMSTSTLGTGNGGASRSSGPPPPAESYRYIRPGSNMTPYV